MAHALAVLIDYKRGNGLFRYGYERALLGMLADD